MRIVYFGCDPFVSCFERLLAGGHQIVSLFTFHNPHDWYNEQNITRLARENGVPVCYGRLEMREAELMFAQNRCDAFFSAEYNWKIPVPAIPSFRGVNVHNMLLPESPGFFPIETQLFLRKKYSGVTLHKLTDSFDGGDVLYSEQFALPPDARVEDVYRMCADIAAKATGEIFSDFEAAWQSAVPQAGERLTRHITVGERTISADTSIGDARHLWNCFRTYCYVRAGGRTYRVVDMRPARTDCADEYIWLDSRNVMMKLRGGTVCLTVEEK